VPVAFDFLSADRPGAEYRRIALEQLTGTLEIHPPISLEDLNQIDLNLRPRHRRNMARPQVPSPRHYRKHPCGQNCRTDEKRFHMAHD
jgi:hypothetical protein